MAVDLLQTYPDLTYLPWLHYINLLVSESRMDAFSNLWPSSCKLDPRLICANGKSQCIWGDMI